MCVFIVWVFFYVWTGVSKSVLGQILCLFLIVKRDSENSLSFMAWFNSSVSPERHCADHVTLVWIHEAVQVWNGSWFIVWGRLQNLNSIQNHLDESDLSSRVSRDLVAFLNDFCILVTWSWHLLWQRSALTLRLKFFLFRNQTTPFTHSSKFYLYKHILLKDIKF